MAALSRLDLGPNLRTWLGPEFFNNLLAAASEVQCAGDRAASRRQAGGNPGRVEPSRPESSRAESSRAGFCRF
jgi:hypothetical protein